MENITTTNSGKWSENRISVLQLTLPFEAPNQRPCSTAVSQHCLGRSENASHRGGHWHGHGDNRKALTRELCNESLSDLLSQSVMVTSSCFMFGKKHVKTKFTWDFTTSLPGSHDGDGICWLVDNNETYWNFLYSRKLQIESFQPWNLGIYQLPQLIQPVQTRQCRHAVSMKLAVWELPWATCYDYHDFGITRNFHRFPWSNFNHPRSCHRTLNGLCYISHARAL